jgi:hypothetical protein
MALVLPNGVRYALNHTWTNGRPVVFTWHAILVATGPRAAGVQESATAVADAWATSVLPQLVNNITLQSVGFLDLNSEVGTAGDVPVASAPSGGQAASSVPPNIGILVTKLIADKGRGRRSGRIFLPGGSEASVDEDGIIIEAATTLAETTLQGFANQVNAYVGPNVASLRLVVAHTPHVEETVTLTRKVPAKTGTMTSSEIVGFDAKQITSGIHRRVVTS